jgi:hypothetical protein
LAHLTRTTPAKIAEECAKPDALTIRRRDIPNMVDAVFDGDHKMPGWVLMFASAKGIGHVDDLFPESQIEWHELPPGLPDDWRHIRVNLPEVVSATKTRLQLEVIHFGRTIDDCTPDQFALLLAFGVRRDGGRAAIIRRNNGTESVEFFLPRAN